jgi:hypothetical protein
MYVKVDQTGDNQPASVIANRQCGILRWQPGKNPVGFSFYTNQKGIGHGFERAGACTPTHIALYNKIVVMYLILHGAAGIR